MTIRKEDFINREVSWLSFNERVLQEAQDESVPILQRIRFLGIFSNNLDEFFRVRVAAIKRLVNLGNNRKVLGGMTPIKLLDEINKTVIRQQRAHQVIFKNLIEELKLQKIFLVNETQVSEEHGAIIRKYFHENVRPYVVPIMVKHTPTFPYLNDKPIYFAIKLHTSKDPKKTEYAILEVQTDVLPRFKTIQSKEGTYIIMLDDIIRYCLKDIFSIFKMEHAEAYTIKVTRDAELDLDDDISKSFLEKMSLSLQKRKKGAAVRFVYDAEIPEDLLNYLIKKLKFGKNDSIIGGARYHNFKDFIGFPCVGPTANDNIGIVPIPHKDISPKESILSAVRQKDILLHFPYQSFSYFIDLLREAAIDLNVESIQITLYRVAPNSKIINALINAAKNGKEVTVVIELQARFDEKSNIKYAQKLKEEGLKVIFGVQGLKVHSKIALITSKEDGKKVRYAYLGTGNFHEGTSKIYTDEGLLTVDKKITNEVDILFQFFSNNYKLYEFKNILVAPFTLRNSLYCKIEREIAYAREGRTACITAKLNSLVDEEMIKKLYEASRAGVKIKLIVRGICSLIPGMAGLSENIEVISIVDKYLEHTRVYYFHADGREEWYISSADWMTRNLDSRIEVACPITNKALRDELRKMLSIQWSDNVKARVVDPEMKNEYRITDSAQKIRSQIDYYDYLHQKHLGY